MKRIVIAILLACLAGCASTPKPVDAKALMQADLLDQAKATASQPLFRLTCPATGCIIASLEVANPAAAAQMAEVIRTAFAPQPSAGMQAFLGTLDVVKSLGSIGLVAHGVSSIMSSVVRGQVDTASAGFGSLTSVSSAGFAANTAIARIIPQPGSTTTYTLSGGGVIGNGTNSTTTTSTTNTNSGNRTCSGASGGNGAGTTSGGAGGSGGPANC